MGSESLNSYQFSSPQVDRYISIHFYVCVYICVRNSILIKGNLSKDNISLNNGYESKVE